MKNTCLVLPALLFLFSQNVHAAQLSGSDLYQFYFKETVTKHLRGGLVGQIESCRSLGYQPCKNRFDGFKFKTTSGDTALFLATLAKDYSIGVHSKSYTLSLIHQVLDAYDRLSRYSTEQSRFLVTQIHQQNIQQMWAEFLIRKPLIQQMNSTGFMIRDDLSEDFDRFANAGHALSGQDPYQFIFPSSHDVVSVLFGLVTVKKYVDDKNIQYKVSQLSKKIFEYLASTDFQITSPKTGERFEGKAKLKNAKYPILVALRYLIDEENLKPKEADFAGTRMHWVMSTALDLEFLRFHCDDYFLAGKNRTKKCNYTVRAADRYLMAALTSLETDEKILKKNFKFFKKTYLHKKRIAKEQSALLAAIALDFYDVPKSIELELALQCLGEAPAASLPNSWARPWSRVFERPMSFVKNLQSAPPDSDSETGFEFPGTDYLMPFVYSAYRH